jgi:hypothetical protein
VCRNIKTLFNFQPPVTEEEIRAASLQFVRKVSGFNKPSKANEASFLAAVDEIAAISGRFTGCFSFLFPAGSSSCFTDSKRNLRKRRDGSCKLPKLE